ncbi:hypothetical protein ACMGD3_03385 [Lysinibacillus sphaericus]|uniref:hypothetical protein n=1 Tax=Lysinibacillus sphaericus TaxID=1421 RepID=UPI003F7AB6E5
MIEVMDRMTRNSNNERDSLDMLTIDQMYLKTLYEAVAFRYGGRFCRHGFSLLVATLLRGLQLMLFPQKSPPALQSTSVRLSVKIMNVTFKAQLYLNRFSVSS